MRIRSGTICSRFTRLPHRCRPTIRDVAEQSDYNSINERRRSYFNGDTSGTKGVFVALHPDELMEYMLLTPTGPPKPLEDDLE
jgi:hypothetical protein